VFKTKIPFHKFTIYRKTHYSGFGVTEHSAKYFYILEAMHEENFY